MTEAARKAKNEYKRAWYQKNREKAKASQARYWAKKAAQAEAEKAAAQETNNEQPA